MKKKHHHLNVEKCGIFFMKNYPMLIASPDRIVSCECCTEKSVLEVKCPWISRGRDVRTVNLPYLFMENGELKINRKHIYFTHLQMQLACTGLKHAYFVIWSNKSTVILKEKFDENFWNKTKVKLEKYYLQKYLKYWFSKEKKNNKQKKNNNELSSFLGRRK